MEHSYRGKIGEFTFDDRYYRFYDDGYLHYVGGIVSGQITQAIPEGVKVCDHMFEGLKGLFVGPALPETCISAIAMFKGCTELRVFPDINLGLMEAEDESVHDMFTGCERLEDMCLTTSDKFSYAKKVSVYVCACQHSKCYPEHAKHMLMLLRAEQNRRVKEFVYDHPFKYVKAMHTDGESAIREYVADNLKCDVRPIPIVFDEFTALSSLLDKDRVATVDNKQVVQPLACEDGMAETVSVVNSKSTVTDTDSTMGVEDTKHSVELNDVGSLNAF